jgi:hypothetical protein
MKLDNGPEHYSLNPPLGPLGKEAFDSIEP